MANVVWPDDLPQTPMFENYQESPPALVLRTQMETGAAKQRRRYTAGVRPMRLTLVLTDEELARLDLFFMDDCEGGADRFEWIHPRTGELAIFRFTEPPKYTPVAPDLWKAQLPVELLPS